MPHLNELYEEYKDEGLVVLGVCTANGQENYESVVTQTGMKYPVARDPDLKTSKGGEWVVMWYPTYVVIDRKGDVRASGVINKQGIEEIIKKLLEEKAPTSGDAEGAASGSGDDASDGAPEVGSTPIPEEFLEGRNDRAEIQAMVGKPAPELTVERWTNTDTPLDLAKLEGKVIMLDYWATW